MPHRIFTPIHTGASGVGSVPFNKWENIPAKSNSHLRHSLQLHMIQRISAKRCQNFSALWCVVVSVHGRKDGGVKKDKCMYFATPFIPLLLCIALGLSCVKHSWFWFWRFLMSRFSQLLHGVGARGIKTALLSVRGSGGLQQSPLRESTRADAYVGTKKGL